MRLKGKNIQRTSDFAIKREKRKRKKAKMEKVYNDKYTL